MQDCNSFSPLFLLLSVKLGRVPSETFPTFSPLLCAGGSPSYLPRQFLNTTTTKFPNLSTFEDQWGGVEKGWFHMSEGHACPSLAQIECKHICSSVARTIGCTTCMCSPAISAARFQLIQGPVMGHGLGLGTPALQNPSDIPSADNHFS